MASAHGAVRLQLRVHLADEPVKVWGDELGRRVSHGRAREPGRDHHHRQKTFHGMLQEAENQLSTIVFSAWVGHGGEIGMLPLSIVDWIRDASLMTELFLPKEP